MAKIPNDLGYELLETHNELENRLRTAGAPGMISLIAACIDCDYDRAEAIKDKVYQLAGPEYRAQVDGFLERHSYAWGGWPKLWHKSRSGRYHLFPAVWQTGKLEFSDVGLFRDLRR